MKLPLITLNHSFKHEKDIKSGVWLSVQRRPCQRQWCLTCLLSFLFLTYLSHINAAMRAQHYKQFWGCLRNNKWPWLDIPHETSHVLGTNEQQCQDFEKISQLFKFLLFWSNITIVTSFNNVNHTGRTGKIDISDISVWKAAFAIITMLYISCLLFALVDARHVAMVVREAVKNVLADFFR